MTVPEQLRQEGLQQGVQDVARSMLLEGFDPALIAKITNLPAEVLGNLKKKIKR